MLFFQLKNFYCLQTLTHWINQRLGICTYLLDYKPLQDKDLALPHAFGCDLEFYK